MNETVFDLCLKIDVIALEIDLALDALSIIQESIGNSGYPGSEQYSNAITCISNSICGSNQELQELISKVVKEEKQ